MLPLVACLLAGLRVATGTPGTQFIVGFMENVESKFPPQLVIGGNPHTSSHVKVTCPGLNFSRSLEVPRLGAARVEVPVEAVSAGTWRGRKGISIDSSADVTVFGLNTASANSVDGFTALPRNHLGVEYRAISTNVSGLLAPDQRWSQLLVVGAFDDTTVEIQLAAPARYQNASYGAGETLEVRVSRLETVQLQSQRDLTGTRVTSSRPIAAMSGSKCANVPADVEACDHLVEYLPPAGRLGREFILPTMVSRAAGDRFRLIGFEPQTWATVAAPSVGNVTVQLGAGEFYAFGLHSLESGYVTSSRPIAVAQYSQGAFADGGVRGDPAMLLVTPTERWGGGRAVVFSTYDVTADGLKAVQSYVTVTSRCSFADDVAVDGMPLSVPKELVAVRRPGGEAADFCVLRSQLGPGTHVISSAAPEAVYAAYVYGFGRHVAYAYPVLGMTGPPSADAPRATAAARGEGRRREAERHAGTRAAHWVATGILVLIVCLLLIWSLVLRRRLRAVTAVIPMHTDKPRPINSE